MDGENNYMLDLNEQIREWRREYCITEDVIYPTYRWIDEHTLGVTYFKSDIIQCRICDIIITDVFKDYELASKAVLWHEFCHAEIWIKYGKTDSHSSAWNGRLWRKPILALLDYIYTQILWLCVKNKHD